MAWLLLCACILGACSHISYAPETPSAQGPPPDQARVYFVLNQKFPPSRAYVTEGAKLVGAVEHGQHTFVDVPAGKHLFQLISSNREAIQGTLLAGKTYHVRIHNVAGRTYWSPQENSGEDLATRTKDLEETQYVVLYPDRAAEWEEDNEEDVLEQLEEYTNGKEKVGQSFEAKHAL